MNIDAMKRRLDKLEPDTGNDPKVFDVYLVGVSPDGKQGEPVLLFRSGELIEETEQYGPN